MLWVELCSLTFIPIISLQCTLFLSLNHQKRICLYTVYQGADYCVAQNWTEDVHCHLYRIFPNARTVVILLQRVRKRVLLIGSALA